MAFVYVTPPPNHQEILTSLDPRGVGRVLSTPLPPAEYLHWDKLRHLAPPDDLTAREWWLRLKLDRLASSRDLPLMSETGTAFWFTLPDRVLELLHLVDQRCSGEIASDAVVTADGPARRRYLVNSLMEEAIRSSQLEGATTTRAAAKELLRTGRTPIDRSERMIVNNYRGMKFIREEMGDELTIPALLELHRILTDGTLDDPLSVGRFQPAAAERVAVFDRFSGALVHRPPPASELPARMKALCAFANSRNSEGRFIHPVVRAIVLHFWLGHDHPFEDGNGRTARALFYWSMRTQGYWLVEYLAISRILQQAPGQYMRAYYSGI